MNDLAHATRNREAGLVVGRVCFAAAAILAFYLFYFATASAEVTIQGFRAQAQTGRILVSWSTGSELTNMGFRLYKKTGSGNFTHFADIPSKMMGAPYGFSYNYPDTDVTVGQTYQYRIHGVASGTGAEGPGIISQPIVYGAPAVSATPPTPTATRTRTPTTTRTATATRPATAAPTATATATRPLSTWTATRPPATVTPTITGNPTKVAAIPPPTRPVLRAPPPAAAQPAVTPDESEPVGGVVLTEVLPEEEPPVEEMPVEEETSAGTAEGSDNILLYILYIGVPGFLGLGSLCMGIAAFYLYVSSRSK